MQGALAAVGGALGPDGAVELVFNLQQAGTQLVVVTTRVANAQLLVCRVGLGQCLVERVGIAIQPVVADVDRCLRIALVAQTPHAQRSGIGQIQRFLPIAQRQQAVLTAFYKAGAQGR